MQYDNSKPAQVRGSERLALLSGMYGSVNVGDEALALALAEGLRRRIGSLRFCMISQNARASEAFNPLRNVEWFEAASFSNAFWRNCFSLLGRIRQSDLVVIGGGDLFHDDCGWTLAGGNGLIAALACLCQKPTFLLGVGVGELERPWLQRALSRVFFEVDRICVRDPASAKVLLNWSVPHDKIILTADLALTIDFAGLAEEVDEQYVDPFVAVIFRPWPDLEERRCADFLDELVGQGHQLRLYAYEPETDARFYRRVLAKCRESTRRSTEIVVPRSLAAALSGIAHATCVYSMRLHGCLFAVGIGRPLIPITYAEKVTAFIDSMGMRSQLRRVSDIGRELAAAIEEAQSYRDQRYRGLSDQAKRNFDVVASTTRQSVSSAGRGWRLIGAVISFVLAGIAFKVGKVLRRFRFSNKKPERNA
jgi:polysaccharide pyruvyl transferase WcaK-like protein